ncbi:hypothetical protein [Maribacter sp. 2307UL18-2]|uniref:hypothetical protein n=1 Tax=Maribacter sp. 2307UL18-2 TaxID=3386274 RepID=UPI0039BD169E
MIRKIVILLIAAFAIQSIKGQAEAANGYRNFPLIVTLQFHSLSMPFKNLKGNFKNIGIGIGTEVSHNGKQNWVQQINLMWYRNNNVGNGWFIYSQAVWRPTLVNNLYTELKLGAGYMITSRPTESFKQQNGEWISVGKKGKGLFAIPAGVSLGYAEYSDKIDVSPFASYQFVLVKGYNESIPLVPQTLIQLGSRIHFNE